MAKTEDILLKGKVKWFKHTAPNKYGRWSHDLYMDEESLEKFRKLQSEGVLTKLRKEEDGYVASIGRPVSKSIAGKEQGFIPPLVFQSDGKTPLTEGLVGNGSDVTTKVRAYQYRVPGTNPVKYGKAIRWESTRVDTLVPFVMNKSFSEEEQKMAEGLSEQPPQQLF